MEYAYFFENKIKDSKYKLKELFLVNAFLEKKDRFSLEDYRRIKKILNDLSEKKEGILETKLSEKFTPIIDMLVYLIKNNEGKNVRDLIKYLEINS